MAITSAFQADDTGSIPVARSIAPEEGVFLRLIEEEWVDDGWSAE